ncbi:MAG: pro-sigmaK processing inhibitor BofA [Firmicutes bacterium]|nr:pro-sigmaK processing inhibitor BofA [Bacillota bacterium]
MFDLDINFILAFLFGIFVLYLLARVLYFPLRIFFRFLLNSIAGGVLLAIFNYFGALWGLQIGLNIVTAIIVGLLGVPGILLLLILQYLTG